MNILGLVAVALSIAAFAFTYSRLRPRPLAVRLVAICILSGFALPAVLFAIYYLHILPERAWFYTLRSWWGSDFLVLFVGAAAGAFASLLPRFLLGFPLFAALASGVIPHLKPLIGPLPDSAFQERWESGACLQSTQSTCGPASVATMLRKLGVDTSEQAIARAAYSYVGGTEAWYLARYVRSKGLTPHFDFRSTFSPDVGFPALVGVRLGGAGHFIAVLEVRGEVVRFVDPLSGEEKLSLAHFQRRYPFTGFHMVISDERNG
jgi:hypothetical protein